jgi:hypothetical protein
LLAAFTGELFVPADLHRVENDEQFYLMLADLIRSQTDVPPLELLARVALQAGDDDVANDIFSSYDRFLDVLANPEARAKLEAVRFEDALDEPAYSELRDVSQRFRHGITAFLRRPSETVRR